MIDSGTGHGEESKTLQIPVHVSPKERKTAKQTENSRPSTPKNVIGFGRFELQEQIYK